jgi:hypothetical protein
MRKLGEARRSADRLQDQVCGGVVAPIDRCRAEIGERHGALGGVRLGDRRVVEQVARPKSDGSVEALGALVHALEHRGCSQKLERAAHREPFVGAMLDRCAGPRLAHKDAEPAGLAHFHLGKLLVGKVQALFG